MLGLQLVIPAIAASDHALDGLIMKALQAAILITTMAFVPRLSAESPQIPNLGDVFPTEHLVLAHREGAIEWYLFETDLEFQTLKRQLLGALGRGWHPVQGRAEKNMAVDLNASQQGGQLLDAAAFWNPRFPDIRVSIHLSEEISADKRESRFVNILKSDASLAGSRRITMPALLRSAAESGDAAAQRQLGTTFFTCEPGGKDLSKAIKWWRKAADQGDALAQFGLGSCYLWGHGVARDYDTAMYLFQKAAKQGLPAAHYAIGVCYDEGKGVEKNPGRAAKHFLRAAERNYPDAQFNLGVNYLLGSGVKRDPLEAYAWFSLSDQAGGSARPQLDYLLRNLSPKELIQAEKRAAELAALIETNLAMKDQSHPALPIADPLTD